MNEFLANLKTFFLGAGEKVLLVAAAIIIGGIIIKLVLHIIRNGLAKSKMEKAASKLALQVVSFVLKLLLVYVVWDILGIPSTLFVAITSVAGVAVSLSIQGVLSNFASGVMQLSSKRFKEGDYIKIGAVEGTVTGIDITSITLTTPDNKIIYVPNSNSGKNWRKMARAFWIRGR
ncbi:MAG: mechanosensitive ion channel [Clostridia bacterium]